MINKEEIEVVKGSLDYYITASEDLGEVAISDLEDFLKCVIELEKENKRLEEINKEHQKINGELQEKLARVEEICKGKSIQELGVSELYEDK